MRRPGIISNIKALRLVPAIPRNAMAAVFTLRRPVVPRWRPPPTIVSSILSASGAFFISPPARAPPQQNARSFRII